MTDQQKRAHLREILASSEGAIAPGVINPIFARSAADCGNSAVYLYGKAHSGNFAAIAAVREMLLELKNQGTEQDYF